MTLKPKPCRLYTHKKRKSWDLQNTVSSRRLLSYRNQSTELLCKSIDWYLCDRNLCYKRVKFTSSKTYSKVIMKTLKGMSNNFSNNFIGQHLSILLFQIFHSVGKLNYFWKIENKWAKYIHKNFSLGVF